MPRTSAGRAAPLALVLAPWLASLAPGFAVSARGAEPPETRSRIAHDPSCYTAALVPTAGVGVLRLPRGFLREGSDSVWTTAGPWQRQRDYRLDRLRGDLRLLRMTAPGETVWVRACGLVHPPALEYVRQEYRPGGNLTGSGTAGTGSDSAASKLPLSATRRPGTAHDPAVPPPGATLAMTGNKTLAVEFGTTQDAALRQSLDLSVSGHVAPGVELTGVLSDRDTPLSAGGATQELQSLDRVLVELKARDGTGALGDIPLALTRGEFARFERRVQGVMGEWRPGPLTLRTAAAGSQGEYARMQFTGVNGQQGPYVLTDRNGAAGITVVAGSEAVTVDGVRMTRGEAADYVLDYERARLTFSNRRPISSASRISVEYQYALTTFGRNVALASSEWQRGAWSWFAHALTEGDDSGRPLVGTLDAADRLALAQAGDSLALGAGVTPGVGDYDTVRVGGESRFAFAGLDSGAFAVRFARVGEGRGDYADSALVGIRTVYRWVGPGLGAYRVGRALSAPESHRLAAVGARLAAGLVHIEAEGALSRRDRNTLSARDGADDAGGAGRLTMSGEGTLPLLPGRVGLGGMLRAVDRRFEPFSRLERAFAEEDWGLPAGADLEHQRRADGHAWWQPAVGRELRAEFARLTTPDGFSGLRRRASGHTNAGAWSAEGSLLDADGRVAARAFPDGARRRALGELRWAGAWVAPMLRFENDRRERPGDTAAVHDRVQSLDADAGNGSRTTWRWRIGSGVRRDERAAGRSETRSRARSWRGLLETPAGSPLGVALAASRRDTRDETSGALVRHDLASARLRGEWRPAGLSGSLQVERTSEAENRRVRTLTFVGAGRGSYDATGNFVGTGDYDLLLTVSPELERVGRTATSARTLWTFGSSEAWRGSRVEFTLEDEARRRGGARLADVFLSTGLALVDRELVRASILQRFESELAPGSRASAFRMRAERRVTADRSFENFGQATDLRSGALRWRARPGAATSAEAEARVQWSRATQALSGGAAFERTLVERVATGQLVWQPAAQWRLAGAIDMTWSMPLGQTDATRTLRLGPDIAAGVGRAGRADVSLRRAFVTGPPALGLLPSADPAGAARWDGTARFSWRLHETTTFALDAGVRERPGRRATVTGRAEVRAFF